MTLREARKRQLGRGLLPRLLGPAAVAVGTLFALPAWAAPPAVEVLPPTKLPLAPPVPAPTETPGTLAPDAAIRWALEHNPEIAALRQQHGIAAAGLIIAKQYPFNPNWEMTASYATGPEFQVLNSLPVTNRITLEMELRGQGKIRREAAAAALSRTDWEIANQEVTLAVRVVRAFDTVVYRFRKRRLILDTIALNQKTLKDVEDILKAGQGPQRGVTVSDTIQLRAEVRDGIAQLSPAHAALVTAWHDLYRALGVSTGEFDLRGGLEAPPPLELEADGLLQAALERRPDLRARQVALREADAHVRLEVANRWGNPSFGPSMEYNESRVTFIGGALVTPLPVLNGHRGEIQQREAERARAALDLRQNEVVVQQDVRAAVARLAQARGWVSTYQRDVVPDLEKALKEMQAQYAARAGGADLMRVLDVQRKLLHARDIELDAVLELRQALADLALAVGDPGVAVPPCPHP